VEWAVDVDDDLRMFERGMVVQEMYDGDWRNSGSLVYLGCGERGIGV